MWIVTTSSVPSWPASILAAPAPPPESSPHTGQAAALVKNVWSHNKSFDIFTIWEIQIQTTLPLHLPHTGSDHNHKTDDNNVGEDVEGGDRRHHHMLSMATNVN